MTRSSVAWRGRDEELAAAMTVAAFLRSCGCSTAQGVLYSRPQPAAGAEAWLRDRG